MFGKLASQILLSRIFSNVTDDFAFSDLLLQFREVGFLIFHAGCSEREHHGPPYCGGIQVKAAGDCLENAKFSRSGL